MFKLTRRIKPKLLTAALLLNALAGFLAIPALYIEKLILDRLIGAIGNTNWQEVLWPVAMLVALGITLSFIRNSLNHLIRFLTNTLSRYFDAELSILIGTKLTELDIATIEDPDFRDRFTKIQNESGRRAWGLMMPFSDIPNSLVGFISASAVLLFIHPLVTLGVLLFSIPQFFLNSRFIKKEYELSTELSPLRKTWGWLEGYLLRNRSFLELKLLNLQEYLAHKLKKTVEEVVDKWVDLSKRREFSRFWGRIPLSIFEMGLTIVLIYWVILQRITIGTFQLYVRSLRLAEENLASLVSSFLEIYENYIYVNDLVWFLNLKPQIEGGNEGLVIESTPRVQFENVSFRYTPKGPYILKNLNFSIKPGETIALVGENGAGKSTLIKLLARFYDPNKGEVLVNDYKLPDVNLRSWRKQIAILFQLFELYPFSAKEAIGYGDVERIGDLPGIKEAAQKTGIDEFIEGLPLQYDNPVSPEFEKGVMPSIGQWQRFGISRMLFRKDARILVLDEPTSNVDPEAEEKIFKELAKLAKNKIIIFVTQRFSTVRIADRIFVMHGGQIVEQGTHKELMKLGGKYAKLFTLQAQAYFEESQNSKVKSQI